MSLFLCFLLFSLVVLALFSDALNVNGILIVKENVTSSNKLEIDTEDSSVTRPLAELQECFGNAGLSIVREKIQHRMPKGLYPVYMFALRPAIAPSHEIN